MVCYRYDELISDTERRRGREEVWIMSIFVEKPFDCVDKPCHVDSPQAPRRHSCRRPLRVAAYIATEKQRKGFCLVETCSEIVTFRLVQTTKILAKCLNYLLTLRC